MGVVIDQNKCRGCRKCINICPGNIIRINDSGKAYLNGQLQEETVIKRLSLPTQLRRIIINQSENRPYD